MWTKKKPVAPPISLNSGPEKDPAFKKKAIFVVVIAAIIWGLLQLLPMLRSDPPPAEATPAPEPAESAEAAVESGAPTTPSYDALPRPGADVIDLQTEDRQPSRAERDPLLAKVAPRLECSRFLRYVEDGFQAVDPFVLAQRAVAVDILTDIGCLDAARTNVALRPRHPDLRLLQSGRAAPDNYRAAISSASSRCTDMSRALAVMAEAAPFDSIAEYFSRIDLTQCLITKADGNYLFTYGEWDVSPLEDQGVPPAAITEIRLLRAIRGCADYIYEFTDAAEANQDPSSRAAAFAQIRKRAFDTGCVSVKS